MRHEPKHFKVTNRGDSAEILLYGDIGRDFFGGVSAEEFASEYRAVRDVKVLDVRINSRGGDVFEGYAIYSRLAQHQGRVNVYVDGEACSIASVIAMAGDSIEMSANAEIMIHDPIVFMGGRAEDLLKMVDRLNAHADNIAKTYEARTGNEYSVIRDWMKAETTWSAEDAVSVGFATVVSQRKAMAAFATSEPQIFRSLSEHSSTLLDEWKSPVFRCTGQVAPSPAVTEKPTVESIEARVAELKAKRPRKATV